jgi:molecular chaperone GrpE
MDKQPQPEPTGSQTAEPEEHSHNAETAPAEPQGADAESRADAESQADAGPAGEAEVPSPETLGQLLREAQAKADENWNRAVRAQADLENLRRRHEVDLDKARKFALNGFVESLLPVIDSMELGLAAADDSADVATLREGSELTLKLLLDALGKFNVEVVNPEGEPFNPELHQAMSMQPRDDVPPNTVVAVVQKGYLLNGRLVRPAMVMVSQKPAGAE